MAPRATSNRPPTWLSRSMRRSTTPGSRPAHGDGPVRTRRSLAARMFGLDGRRKRDPDRAVAAHIVRRTSLGIDQRAVDELVGLDHDEAVAAVIDRPTDDGPPMPVTDDWFDPVRWWLERMTEPETGLTDRMTWFWHSLLTTNAWKVSHARMIAEQLTILRSGARGDFRSLLHSFVTSGALLDYLDAGNSVASNPNENLGRELMELYTVGRGHFDEDDVRAAARALAGWVVEDGEVRFERRNAFIAPLIFLGEQAEWDTAGVVDRLCDHPATAARISGLLWEHLVGIPMAEDRRQELGRWWQDRELEIEPLIERILSDPAFVESGMVRPRSGLEWFAAARSVTGFDLDDLWYLHNLDQMPYLPPSPAGWPTGDRWLGAGSILARSSAVHSIIFDSDRLPTTTAEILDRCAIFEVSAATEQSIERVTETPDIDPQTVRRARWRLALTCPEFHLS